MKTGSEKSWEEREQGRRDELELCLTISTAVLLAYGLLPSKMLIECLINFIVSNCSFLLYIEFA